LIVYQKVNYKGDPMYPIKQFLALSVYKNFSHFFHILAFYQVRIRSPWMQLSNSALAKLSGFFSA